MNAILKRQYFKNYTIGNLTIYDGNFQVLELKTLELEWKENRKNISCIPEAEYLVERRTSKKYGEHFHILEVENRDFILIHPANFVYQLRGCIAVGINHMDIDKDGKMDVAQSKKAMNQLLDIMPDEFYLKIQ